MITLKELRKKLETMFKKLTSFLSLTTLWKCLKQLNFSYKKSYCLIEKSNSEAII